MFIYQAHSLKLLTLVLVLLTLTSSAKADSITITGTFSENDDVRLLDLTVGASGTVDIRGYGYAGGTTGTEQVIPRGGFDTIFTLFNNTGVLIAENDDGVEVEVDPITGLESDSRLILNLNAGSYILAITQYSNFARGPNLSGGFELEGEGNFAGGFGDASTFRSLRNQNWAVSFDGVTSATPRPIPEPVSAALLCTGLAGVAAVARRRRLR